MNKVIITLTIAGIFLIGAGYLINQHDWSPKDPNQTTSLERNKLRDLQSKFVDEQEKLIEYQSQYTMIVKTIEAEHPGYTVGPAYTLVNKPPVQQTPAH